MVHFLNHLLVINVITIVDHFSSWPEAIATPNKSADTVAKVLLEEINAI